MRIVCWSCDTSYELAAAALGKFGRSVRCVRCEATWFAAARAPELALTAERIDAPVGQADDRDPPSTIELTSHSTALALISASDPALRAEPETIDHIGLVSSLVPAIECRAAPEAPPAEAAPVEVETVPARRAPPPVTRPSRSFRPSAPVVILGLTAVLAGLIAGRAEVVRFAPQTASLFARVGLTVNLRGLSFDAVKVSRETHDGVPVMVIDGAIVNAAKAAVDLPRMRFALRNQAGVEVYAWSAPPTRPVLNEGETLPFRTRLASPPADGRELQVRFFNSRDLEIVR